MTPVKKQQPDYRAWRGLDLDDVQVDRPSLPKSWVGGIGTASALAVISVIVIPAVALLRMTIGEAAAVIQAATSWFGAVLTFVAGIVAVLAYRGSTQRPDLVVRYRHDPDGLWLRISNDGPVSAEQPAVKITFDPPYPYEDKPGVAAGWRPVDWEGDFWWWSIAWSDDELILHPGFAHDLPGISFPTEDRDGRNTYEIRGTITWSGTGALLKRGSYRITVPTAR